MTPERDSKQGLVLTGGGAKGAYEIGILKALFAGRSPATGCQPLEPEVFTGTSVGAYNAAFLASQTDVGTSEAMARLETIWRKRIGSSTLSCGNGVFRLRDGPLNVPDPGCFIRPLETLADTIHDAAHWARYLATRGAQFVAAPLASSLEIRFLESVNLASLFDPEPLYQLIDDTLDREQLSASDKTLTIPATDWQAGKLKLFDRTDIAGPIGLRGIAASAAIPGIFPPVFIDGVAYHDGGVLQNTPLKPAIDAGAEVIHVIYLDPQVADLSIRSPPNTIDTVYRMFMIIASTLLSRDVADAVAVQHELELHRDLGIMSGDFLEVLADPGSNSRVLRRFRQGRPYRPLTIHRYRPETDLGGGAGLLDFSVDFIDRLIAQGHEDAIRHDCEASDCLLPRPYEGARRA